MRIRIITALPVFIAVIFALASVSTAEDELGSVSAVRGRAVIERDNKTSEAKVKDHIYLRDSVSTFDASRAKLLFVDDSVLTLGERSRIEIKEFVYSKEYGGRSLFNLVDGRMRAVVGKTRFEVRTPTSVASARGTIILFETGMQDGKLYTAILCLEGTVEVSSPDPRVLGKVIFGPGMMVTVYQGEPLAPAIKTPESVKERLMGETDEDVRKPEAGIRGEVLGAMVKIPKGWFIMGSSSSELNERPEHEVFVDEFMIDRFEVSAKEFAAFLNDKGNPGNKYVTLSESSTVVEGQGSPKYIPRKGFENYPANNVSWFGADEYCRWVGKRLPTEAEWEKAARGNDKRLYPWGNTLSDKGEARYRQKWEERGLEVLLPVDSLPEGASFYGVFNQAGNVLEWIHDWYRQNYCDFCDPAGEEYLSLAAELSGTEKAVAEQARRNPDAPPKKSPSGPAIGSFRVLRGGAWKDVSEAKLRSTFRYWLEPQNRDMHIGFRCAK